MDAGHRIKPKLPHNTEALERMFGPLPNARLRLYLDVRTPGHIIELKLADWLSLLTYDEARPVLRVIEQLKARAEGEVARRTIEKGSA